MLGENDDPAKENPPLAGGLGRENAGIDDGASGALGPGTGTDGVFAATGVGAGAESENPEDADGADVVLLLMPLFLLSSAFSLNPSYFPCTAFNTLERSVKGSFSISLAIASVSCVFRDTLRPLRVQ